ncbi:hypothetical protein QAD02_023235 [Eretmocerus hayati]|uniref:Uncharacterized protein n=1 Tax=Eretmocerus hayati TaxID=131215 RepID=A0ACC2PV85_9HYME|nr:hypothetical protein QAD02_023235 [Eretmocerus hayati]
MRPFAQRHIDSLWVTIVWLFVTVEYQFAQECGSSLSGKLLVATSTGRILTTSSKGDFQLPPNIQLTQAAQSSELGLASDPNDKKNSIYFSKALTKELYSLHQPSSYQAHWQKLLPTDNPHGGIHEWMPCHLALDTITSRLYVADCLSNIVTVVQDSGLTQGFVRRAIILDGLTKITGMAIDPTEGLLFVADKYKIHRVDLDGASHQVILAEYQSTDDLIGQIVGDLPPALKQSFKYLFGKRVSDSTEKIRKSLNIGDIALDLENRRIFWIDPKKRQIESLGYDGNGRKVHIREGFPKSTNRLDREDATASLAILGGSIYWTDDLKKEVLRMDLHEGKKSRVVLKTDAEEIRKIMGVECLKNQQQIKNPCASGTSQCQHMCVQSRTSSKGYRCLCEIGSVLAKDGRSCTPIKDFILYLEDSDLHAKGLDSSSLTIKPSTDLFYPTTFATGFLYGVEADLLKGTIYWSSSYPQNKIHERHFNSINDTILKPDLLSKDVGRFAYDWTTGNLYYFTYYYANYFTLSVLNTNDPSYSKILVETITGLISGIDLHPDRGYVFYAQDYRNTTVTISRIQMDGSGLTILVQLRSGVEALAVDRGSDRLYWADSSSSVIHHTDLDGRDRKQLSLPNGFNSLTSMSFLGNWLYAIVSGNSKIVRLDKSTGSSPIVLISRELPDTVLPPLKVVTDSNRVSSLAESLCGLGKHNCAKFCFAVPDLSYENKIDAISRPLLRRQCGCPYGEVLSIDGRSCVDDRQRQPAFRPCNFSFKCDKITEGNAT